MRRAGPLLAAAVVLLANAVALVGVARNRSGRPEAEVLFTERELSIAPGSDESTGTFLELEWKRWLPSSELELPWLDAAKLGSLGIDCSYPPEAEGAGEHYLHAVPRRAYVALEYDGPAWARWLAAREAGPTKPAVAGATSASRLVPIDAGLDPGELRRAHPDRSHTLVVPAIVRPWWVADRAGGKALSGRIHLLVPTIHVPRDLAAPLATLRAADAAASPSGGGGPHAPAPPRRDGAPRYEVLLRYGGRHEAWVADLRLISRPAEAVTAPRAEPSR